MDEVAFVPALFFLAALPLDRPCPPARPPTLPLRVLRARVRRGPGRSTAPCQPAAAPPQRPRCRRSPAPLPATERRCRQSERCCRRARPRTRTPLAASLVGAAAVQRAPTPQAPHRASACRHPAGSLPAAAAPRLPDEGDAGDWLASSPAARREQAREGGGRRARKAFGRFAHLHLGPLAALALARHRDARFSARFASAANNSSTLNKDGPRASTNPP